MFSTDLLPPVKELTAREKAEVKDMINYLKKVKAAHSTILQYHYPNAYKLIKLIQERPQKNKILISNAFGDY